MRTMNDVLVNTSPQRGPLELDEAQDAILARWADPDEQASEDEEEAALVTDEETDGDTELDEQETEEVDLEDDTDPEEDEEPEEEEEDDDAEEAEILADDAEVEILVEGETHRAAVKDLKRLYGQEAALTRKSQAVSQQRKQAEDALSKSDALMQAMLKRAEDRFEPYSNVDMLLASKTMDAEDFAALRKEAQSAQEDVLFLKQEADQFYSDLQRQHQAAQKEAAREAVKVLTETIPDWSNETYADIRSYAVAQGLPEEQVNTIIDPVVVSILNKSRLYDQGKRVATVKKKAATKKKVLRSQKAPNPKSAKKAKVEAARQKMLENGGNDLDQIAAVIMGRWEEA